MRHYLTGDLHTQVVEAHTSVGAVGQSEGSGDHTMGVGSMVQVGVHTSSINKGLGLSITLANHMSVSKESGVSSVTSVSRQSSIGRVWESSIVVVVIESISSINKRGGVSCIIQKGISIGLRLSISITLANHMSVSSESSVSSVSRQSSIGRVGESSIVVVVIESISSINKRGGVSCIIQKGISISLRLSISITLAN